jgi:hypothetical protein
MDIPTSTSLTAEQSVTALLAAAGIDPSEADRAAIAVAYPLTRALADLLYAVPEARYAEPAPTWSATP